MTQGSHNSLTYCRPRRWWGWLCRFVWRCQRKSLWEQYDAGANAFDIRVRWRKDGRMVAAHGWVELDCDVTGLVDGLIDRARADKRPLTLRLIHETTRLHSSDHGAFARWAQTLVARDVKVIGGRDKRTWRKLVLCPDGDVVQPVGSMSGSLLGKFWPWLWWRLRGKAAEVFAEATAHPDAVILKDFV